MDGDDKGQLIVAQENLSKAGWNNYMKQQAYRAWQAITDLCDGRGFNFIFSCPAFRGLLPTLVKDYFVIRPGKNNFG